MTDDKRKPGRPALPPGEKLGVVPARSGAALGYVGGMSAAKTTSERVEKMRQEREAIGLRRRELYAHDDDWPKVREVASKLLREREEQTKS